MKLKSLISTLSGIFACVLTSCSCSLILGKGEMVKEERKLDIIREVNMSVVGKVYIIQGNEQKVEIEGQKNILKILETRVDSGRLEIFFNKKYAFYRKLILNITLKDIEILKISGSSNMYSKTTINAQNLALKVSGSGSIALNGLLVTNLQSEIAGSGTIKLETIKAQNLKVKVNGSGLLKVNNLSVPNLQSEINGSGSIKLDSGNMLNNHEVKISGSGNHETGSLSVNEAEVSINGSGKCKIKVNNKLKARIIGSGRIYYLGNCQLDSDVSGSGKVKKID
jgi:hypothetical protein